MAGGFQLLNECRGAFRIVAGDEIADVVQVGRRAWR
jgi:hypothetical protein